MKILIAGGTGFVGRCLVASLLQDRHEVLVLGRDHEKIKRLFGAQVVAVTWPLLDTIDPSRLDAVVNLSGHNIGSGRWSRRTKKQIVDSRVDTTALLIKWCALAKIKPHFYSASAVGVYGLQPYDSAALTEQSELNTPPQDFLSYVGQKWEQEALKGRAEGMEVTLMRFGIVLELGQGMMKKLTPAFALGLGSVIGSGDQVLSWIAVDDLVAAIMLLLRTPKVVGPVNMVAPNPVSQRQFARQLAQAMRRPCLLRLPAWFVKLMFGQMGHELLLSGQRVAPTVLQQLKFHWRYQDLDSFLTDRFGSR